MKKLLKRLGLFLLTLIFGIVLAGILLPVFYKEELLNALKEIANEKLTATVDFKDASLSFFRSFPDIEISIDSLSVMGRDTFDGIILYKAPQTSISFNFTSLIGKNRIPEINNITATKPEINIVILDTIHANYLITNNTAQDSAAYQLMLESYKISGGKLTYQDNTLNLFMVADNVNHSGNGDFTQDIFNLDTDTEIKDLYLKYSGTEYLKHASASLKSKINVNFPEQKYTLLDNILKINDLDIKGDGYVQFKEEGILNDFSFKTESESFKSLISILPNAYTKDFNNVKSSGSASFSGNIKGIYNSEMNMMPAFDLSIIIKDGNIKYPSFPQEIKNVNGNIEIKATRPDYRDMTLKIPEFKALIGNDPIEGNLFVTNMVENQNMSGKLKGRLNLKNFKEAYPIPDIEELSGTINCDLTFQAKMSDINNENYNAIKFEGQGDGNSIKYRSKGMPLIVLQTSHLSVAPDKLIFSAELMKMGKSDVNLDIFIKNPLALFSTEKSMQLVINAKSNTLDLNEWMTDTAAPSEKTKMPYSFDEDLLKNSGITLNIKAGSVDFHDKTIENMAIEGTLSANALNISNLSAKINESDLKMYGTVVNAYDYLFNKGILDGNINLSSHHFNANQFLSNASSDTKEPISVIAVPDRLRLNIKAQIDDLIYTNLNLKDFSGTLEVKNNEVALRNLETNTLGGKLAFEGIYNTSDLAKPDFSVKLDLSKIKFVEAFSKIDMFKKAAPIAEYIDGIFNSTLVMKGKLGHNMMPELGSLDASGLLETLSGSLKGFNPMAELANKLGVKELNDINLTNSKNWFDIVQGFVELKAYNHTFKGIDLTISGKHGFGKEMDYNLDLIIPREIMKNNKVTSAVETGLSAIEKEASRLGININQGPNIFLNVKMTGTIKKPNFKITPKNSAGESIISSTESKINNAISTAEDSIKSELNNKVAELKDSILKRGDEELDKIKSQAEVIADKMIDSVKTKVKDELGDKLDSLTKGVISDSLKQKAKDVLNKKTTDDVDKIKEKLKDFNPFKKKGNG
jgi:hypothetical protein